MRKRVTSPPDTGLGDEDKPGASRGNTQTAQGENQHAVPRTYERDQSADSQQPGDPSQERVGRIGKADADRGVADTTKGAELDATYDKLREDLPDGEKKFRP
jgi:hypothetical protein